VDEFGSAIWIDSIAAPAITDSILTTGAVIGYFISPTYLSNGDSTIVNVDNSDVSFLIQIVKPGLIILYSYVQDYSGYSYRYVIIPGKIAISSSSGDVESYTAGQLKSMDYSTLSGLLHIPAKGMFLKPNFVR
jgi:hypothetical protein